MQKADRIVGILILLISILFGYQATRLPGPIGGRGIGPGGMPLVISIGPASVRHRLALQVVSKHGPPWRSRP